MRLITVFAIFTCAILVSSFSINPFKKDKPEEKVEEKSLLEKMAAKVTGAFTKEEPKVEEKSASKKFSDLWQTLTRAKKEEPKSEDETTQKKWADAFKFKTVWETLKHIKKTKDTVEDVKEEVKSKKWYDWFKIANPWKSKNETKEEKEDKEEDEEQKWFEAFKFGNLWDNVRGKINSGAKKMFKRDYVTEAKIMAAIEMKNKGGIESMMNETKDIQVEKYEFPKAIKTIDTDDASLKNCTHYLKPIVPGLMKFGLNSAIGRVPKAVGNLFDIMKFLPELSKNCLGKEFQIVGNQPDVTMCKKDVTELSQLVAELARHPFHIVSQNKKFKRMIVLIPETVGYCTTAFV